MEGKFITINGGVIDLKASDDGINAAGGSSGDMRQGRFGADNFSQAGEVGIVINGGIITVDADGDGIDSNQSLEVNGGEVHVNGPTSDWDTALDFETRYGGSIHGGIVVAVGSAGMVETMESDSRQCSLTVFMDSVMTGGVPLTVKDSSGKELLTFTPTKNWKCAILSHPDMKEGECYTVSVGDVSVEVTMESKVTVYGKTGRPGGGFGDFGNFGGEGGKGGFGGMRPGDMPGDFNPNDMPKDFNPQNRKNFKDNTLT